MRRKTTPPSWLTLSILAILIVASFSLIVLNQVQESTKNQIKQSLFDKAKAEQIKTTRTISGKISSDLDLVMSRLGQLAALQTFQQGHFTGSYADAILDEKYRELKSQYAIDSVFLANSKNVIVNISKDNNFTRFTGMDISGREHMVEMTQSKAPVFSNWYLGADNNGRITAIYPIINRETNQLVGAVGASVITNSFFSNYGNIYDFNSSQYINVLDRKAVFVASANHAVVGLSFYDDKVQSQFVKHDPALNEFYGKLLSGKASDALFDVGFGERLATGQPIILNGKPAYFLSVGVPTGLIYSDIDNILASQSLLNYFQWIALMVAIGFILLFLMRLNNRLNKEVSKRTEDLATSNAELRKANEQLETNEKLQREFINIAAHELRTPITPILVALHLKQQIKSADGTTQTVLTWAQIEMIERNAKRLERLASDILTVTRIEGKKMELQKEEIDLNEKITHVIQDAKAFVPSEKQIDFLFMPSSKSVVVEADKSKIFEVLSNLIKNAVRFIDTDNGGQVSICIERIDEEKEVVVRVIDNGRGIDPAIQPRLFQKFASSVDFGGTGLGLYISKSIIEAHGGRIWAENNTDGKGATFSFTLPLKQ